MIIQRVEHHGGHTTALRRRAQRHDKFSAERRIVVMDIAAMNRQVLGAMLSGQSRTVSGG